MDKLIEMLTKSQWIAMNDYSSRHTMTSYDASDLTRRDLVNEDDPSSPETDDYDYFRFSQDELRTEWMEE